MSITVQDRKSYNAFITNTPIWKHYGCNTAPSNKTIAGNSTDLWVIANPMGTNTSTGGGYKSTSSTSTAVTTVRTDYMIIDPGATTQTGSMWVSGPIFTKQYIYMGVSSSTYSVYLDGFTHSVDVIDSAGTLIQTLGSFDVNYPTSYSTTSTGRSGCGYQIGRIDVNGLVEIKPGYHFKVTLKTKGHVSGGTGYWYNSWGNYLNCNLQRNV